MFFIGEQVDQFHANLTQIADGSVVAYDMSAPPNHNFGTLVVTADAPDHEALVASWRTRIATQIGCAISEVSMDLIPLSTIEWYREHMDNPGEPMGNPFAADSPPTDFPG